MRTHVYGVSLV